MAKTIKQAGGGRGAQTRPLGGPGTNPITSAMIGGVSNMPNNKSAKKGSKSFNRGGAVRR